MALTEFFQGAVATAIIILFSTYTDRFGLDQTLMAPASGVRRDRCVHYVETRPPDRLVIDRDVVAAAPALIRVAPLRPALETCHVPLGHIPADAIESTMHMLPEYVRHHGLPYGIAHEL
jgi:hypothetical protein